MQSHEIEPRKLQGNADPGGNIKQVIMLGGHMVAHYDMIASLSRINYKYLLFTLLVHVKPKTLI